MTTSRRTAPRRPVAGRQQRGDRTRELLIDETVRCVREEGFSAASARHIIERAGVSWGVIQHHFGDRDGLLTAVIEDAVDRLVASLEVLADPDRVMDTEHLVRATWDAFANPKAMAGLEILIAAKDLRGSLGGQQMQRLGTALAALVARLNTVADREHAIALGMLLWTTPVAMMLAEMFATPPLTTKDAQKAIVKLLEELG
ncbi:TetR/AcrR family transcriptional regulator [Mycobacterium colombiense]|uniref:TetR/AcrR family transcriptional regulator n=1 Tax=Mycobacterium colombiense TaxID=339268 RepID=A0A329K8S9_9MYCO|nr:TetR/AcrR family transcriptional regulator [Mycobacterium colombiense]RAU91300.1 TetR/AcrR family transcriptional regulator [Mycobacterium colombiense]